MTSSPTTTSTRRPRSRAIARAATRRVDPLVVGDGDDVEVGPALDVVEDGLDARGAVAGEGVDVQVGAAARLGHAAAFVVRWLAGRRASASRSGQIGKKIAHHCSGASAIRSSKARREPGHRRRHALAPGAVGRDVDRDELAAKVAGSFARRTVIA